jgi:hypothetical protein
LGLFDVFAGSSLDAILHRARKSMATGDFDEALKAVEKGLAKYPDAHALREVGLSVRRAQAYAGMQGLKDRIAEKGDPESYEQLIALYRDVGMQDEVQRLTERYAAAHPELEAPHLLRGEHALEAFFGDLRASDGRAAIDHLVRAGSLHPDSLKPRMLLAEIYFAIGADRALLGQAAAIERLAGDDVVLQPTLVAIRDAARPAASESVDALLAKVEVSGEILRDPSAWSGRRRRGIASDSDVDRVQRGLEKLVREGTADEAVAIDRAGAVVATSGPELGLPAPTDEAGEAKATGLGGVARAVARTIKAQARELEMGCFRRFVVEGPFGVMVVSDAAGGVVAAKARRGADPMRVAERMSVALDGVRGRRVS